MNTETERNQAAEALQIGKREEARQVLEDLLAREPEDAEAWQLLFSALRDSLEKADCLEQVVRIRPSDELARQNLDQYRLSVEYRAAIEERRIEEGRAEIQARIDQEDAAEVKRELWGMIEDIIFPENGDGKPRRETIKKE